MVQQAQQRVARVVELVVNKLTLLRLALSAYQAKLGCFHQAVAVALQLMSPNLALRVSQEATLAALMRLCKGQGRQGPAHCPWNDQASHLVA